jgi:hypothetical protein
MNEVKHPGNVPQIVKNLTNYIKDNIDLQSITLLSTLKKSIKHFESSNNITSKCNVLIKQINNEIDCIIPHDKTSLKLELLKN